MISFFNKLGANAVKRFFFNVAIRFANIFIRQKMLERVIFGTMEDVRKEFDAVFIIVTASVL